MGRKFKAEKGSVGVCNGGFQNRGRGDLRAESEFFKGGRRKKVGILKGTGYDLGCTSFPPNNSISFEIGDETKLEFVILMKPTTPNYRCQSVLGFRGRNLKMQLTLEFGGGLELLCNSVKIHNVSIDPENGVGKFIMKDLLSWVRSNLIKERPEMFMKGDTVRPGVLVLVNDCDWELSGQLDTTLEEKDVVVFISTLHGG